MGDYTIKQLDQMPDVLGDYPGEMRMITYDVDAEQVALTFRRMPPQTGGKGSYGHYHETQEELYLVLSGTLQFKLGDEVIDVPGGTAVRIAPATVRSVWNAGPEDADLVIASIKLADGHGDAVTVPNFWPDDA